jgi:hypothetical protein
MKVLLCCLAEMVPTIREIEIKPVLIDEMYFRSPEGPVPAAYCYSLDGREALEKMIKGLGDLRREFRQKEYALMIKPRSEGYGIKAQSVGG